jgi:hypothetical protein
MQLLKNETHQRGESGVGPVRRFRSDAWRLIPGCLMAASALACTAQNPPNQPVPTPDKPFHYPIATTSPDANAQMTMREQQQKQQNFDAANAERQRQMVDDSAKLLKLATDLKAEVDKTNKDTLSVNVIRKADEIEHMAHSVIEKMKLSVGSN